MSTKYIRVTPKPEALALDLPRPKPMTDRRLLEEIRCLEENGYSMRTSARIPSLRGFHYEAGVVSALLDKDTWTERDAHDAGTVAAIMGRQVKEFIAARVSTALKSKGTRADVSDTEVAYVHSAGLVGDTLTSDVSGMCIHVVGTKRDQKCQWAVADHLQKGKQILAKADTLTRLRMKYEAKQAAAAKATK
jgi:hypothetical protein